MNARLCRGAGKVKVFISYARHDDVVVQSLAADLAQGRQQVWLDHDLAGGDAWWPEILAQIRACAVFVFALSDESLRSKPCRAELGYAEALGLPILPVQVGPVSTYRTDSIFTKQLVDYREPTRSSGIALISALYERGLERAELPSPLPEPPPIPYEYLLQLGAAIHGTAKLAEAAQASMFSELRDALDNEDDDNVRAEIRGLLATLRGRREISESITREIDAVLGFSPEPTPPDGAARPVAEVTTGAPAADRSAGDAGCTAVAHLHCASGRRYPLQAVSTRIGRQRDNDIVLDEADVSPHHAVIIDTGINYIVNTGANYIINDLRSANGVFVQHQRIRSTATLNDGDHIGIGGHEFTFHITGRDKKSG